MDHSQLRRVASLLVTPALTHSPSECLVIVPVVFFASIGLTDLGALTKIYTSNRCFG